MTKAVTERIFVITQRELEEKFGIKGTITQVHFEKNWQDEGANKITFATTQDHL